MILHGCTAVSLPCQHVIYFVLWKEIFCLGTLSTSTFFHAMILIQKHLKIASSTTLPKQNKTMKNIMHLGLQTNYYEFFTPKPKGKKMNKINHFCISNKSINTKKKKLSKQKNLNNIAALS